MKVNTLRHTYEMSLVDLELYDVFDLGRNFITVQIKNCETIPEECRNELFIDAFQAYQRDADHEGIEDEKLPIKFEITLVTDNEPKVNVNVCGCVFSPHGDISFGDGFECNLTQNEEMLLETLTGFYSANNLPV